eukprot:Colp12_sorted_trinity150504_noHs@5996
MGELTAKQIDNNGGEKVSEKIVDGVEKVAKKKGEDGVEKTADASENKPVEADKAVKPSREKTAGLLTVALIFCVIADVLKISIPLPGFLSASNFLPLSTIAVVLAIIAAPATHERLNPDWWHPFEGGVTYVLLQGLGWTCYGFALLIMGMRQFFPSEHSTRQLTLVGILGTFAQILVLISRRYFAKHDAVAKKKHRKHGFLTWHNVGVMGLVIVSCAFPVCLWAENMMSHTPSKSVDLSLFAMFLVAVGVPLTHGVAGTRKWGNEGYTVFQPFAGGVKYVLLQAIGWALYSLTLLAFMAVVYFGHERLVAFNGLLTSLGLGGFMSQIIILSSLAFYQQQRISRRQLRAKIRAVRHSFCEPEEKVEAVHKLLIESAKDAFIDFVSLITVALFYQLHHLWFFVCVGVIATYQLTGFAYFLALHGLYLLTYFNKPEVTGKREWPEFRKHPFLWSLLERYFDGKVIATSPLDPQKQYLLAFHPHGIYPASALWAPHSQSWKEQLPKVDIAAHSASVTFNVPIIRDVAMWAGSRVVTKEGIAASFKAKKSALIVPGGIAEMLEQWSPKKDITIITKHKGFIRMAIEHGVDLVPVYSFGEDKIWDVVQFPFLQRWANKMLRIHFPHIPFGRWFLPIPRAEPITVVVGAPIKVPH